MISASRKRRDMARHVAREADLSVPRTAYLARALERAVRQQLVRRERRGAGGTVDVLDWGRLYLSRYFALPPSAMHVWLAAQLAQFAVERGSKVNLLGPRGYAKSTVATLAYVLQAAVEAWEPYIWLVSDTRAQAATHLEHIKTELTGNALLAEDYPEATGRGPQWRSERIILRNGVTIEALGAGQHLRGRRRGEARPSLIVADDVQGDRHMASAKGREASRRWFHGTLLKAGNRATNVVHLATALHREALALELSRTPGWRSERFAAIVDWPTRMDLWQQWETLVTAADDPRREQAATQFYVAHREEMHKGAKVLWPEQEDLLTLMRMRIEGGRTAFEREKQNVPHDPAACEWPEDYFAGELWFDDWPRGMALKVVAIDPSKRSDARRGDYSAIVALGLDADGVAYVDADLARRPTSQLVAEGVEWIARFVPDGTALEANQYQELLAGEFAAEFQRRGMTAAGLWLIDNRVNKLVRIRRLGPLLAAKRLRFKAGSAGARLLVDQLRDFPTGDHDDGPDALEMAVRLAGELSAGAPSDGLGQRLVGR